MLLDDRSKTGTSTEQPRFTLSLASQAETLRTVGKESFATLNPSPSAKALRRSAETGSIAAQASLANLYLKGGIGRPKSPELAYQWALIAQANGESKSRHVLRELDLFLTAEQKSEARRSADEFLKKQRGQKK